MRPYYIATALIVVMMAFQNCGKNHEMAALPASEITPPSPVTKIKADEFNSLVMTDPATARFLELDLASGKINGFDDRGISTGEHFCLGERDRLQIDELLLNAEVCQPTVQSAQGENCMMVYQYPYAQLKNANTEINLGEKHNGCEIPTDICGSKAANLKSLVAALVSRVDGMSCDE